MTGSGLTLVGDGIENPANAETLLNAAEMFGVRCLFRERKGRAPSLTKPQASLPTVTLDALLAQSHPLITLDNIPAAEAIYGFRVPPGPSPTLVVGNERFGIAAEIQAKADRAVQIPMFSRNLNTLNVGAAAAVALYYISLHGNRRIRESAKPAGRRPELLLMAPGDHFEAGSSIRSAGAFGWDRILIDDRAAVWFGVERGRRSESRAAARRARNPIRVIPVPATAKYAFAKVTVVTLRARPGRLGSTNLSGGPSQLVVVPDEDCVNVDEESWNRLGKQVEFVRPELVAAKYRCQYRLVASIVAAEIARQVGQRPRKVQERPVRRRPVYDLGFRVIPDTFGETVYLEGLTDY